MRQDTSAWAAPSTGSGSLRRALSISTSFDYDIPVDEQFPLIAAAGFTHVSLGGQENHSGYLSPARRQRLKVLLRASGHGSSQAAKVLTVWLDRAGNSRGAGAATRP